VASRGVQSKEPRPRVPDWELLLALDWTWEGRSKREIGLALRPGSSVQGLWSDSELRSLAKRRIKKAEHMAKVGYLALAAGG